MGLQVASPSLTVQAKVAGVAAPTPERLAKAGKLAKLEAFSTRTVEIGADDIRLEPVKAKRVRMMDSQIARLITRQQLDPKDADMNRVLARAATKYEAITNIAGRQALRAIDLTRGFTTARSTGNALENSERACDALREVEAADAALTRNQSRAVDMIVLQDKSPSVAGAVISHYQAEKIATAIGLYELRLGLRALAIHFGMVVVDDTARA